jgi:hypothetical protein
MSANSLSHHHVITNEERNTLKYNYNIFFELIKVQPPGSNISYNGPEKSPNKIQEEYYRFLESNRVKLLDYIINNKKYRDIILGIEINNKKFEKLAKLFSNAFFYYFFMVKNNKKGNNKNFFKSTKIIKEKINNEI